MPDTNCLSLPGGVPVSKIALGTMYFGSRITREQSERLLDTFVSLGGNQIDTGSGLSCGGILFRLLPDRYKVWRYRVHGSDPISWQRCI